MGRFIVSRTATGVRFLLLSDKGRTLLSSKEYATLDACKKGICSLCYYAPIVPVIDLTQGACAPNPKFELDADGNGFSYAMKSANGKVVAAKGGFATKKACLRAISMLRTGVIGAEVLLVNPAGYIPLTVGGMIREVAPLSYPTEELDGALAYGEPALDEAEIPAPDTPARPPVETEPIDGNERFDDIPGEVGPAPLTPAEPAPVPAAAAEQSAPQRVPRRVQLPGEQALRSENAPAKQTPTPTSRPERGGFFKRFFGK